MAVQGNSSRKRKRPKKGLLQFTKWKQIAVEKLIEDDELMKLLVYNTKDWARQPDIPMEDRYDLVDKNIFQYRYINKIAEQKQSYVSMGLSYFAPQEGFRQFSDDYVMGYFYFYVICDRDIRSTNSGDRADLIAGRIYDIFQESKYFGIGELRMETQGELWQDNNSHGGYTVGFQLVEFK